MKRLLFSFLLLSGISTYAQVDTLICNELPIANPNLRAVCKNTDLAKHFNELTSGALSKGSHSASFKIYVDCHGAVKEAYYQRGNFSIDNQKIAESKIKELTWKAAENKSKPVTSVVFITLEIVNNQISVTVK